MQSLAFVISHFALAYGLAWGTNWIGLIAWRRSTAAHWTERARLLWPARVTAASNLLIIPAALNVVHSFVRLEVTPHWMVTLVAGVLGALFGSFAMQREIFGGLRFKQWLHQSVPVWGIYTWQWIALLAGIGWMPDHFGWGAALVTVLFLVLHFGMQFGLLRILQRAGFLFAPCARLKRIVSETSARMGVAEPGVLEYDSYSAQAFAFTIDRKLLFARTTLEIYTDDEISAVCAHELAHLAESKWALLGRLMGSLTYFPLIFLLPVASVAPMGIFVLLLCPSLISIFTLKLSQHLEERADSAAFGQETVAGTYARALEKLYKQNHLPAITPARRKTHPHLYDRLLAANIAPDYPRPRAPQRLTLMFWVYAGLIIAVIILDTIGY